ncbi:MAG: hypothetical protein OEU92_02305 [Alphaproteobacteria bacterium]|nr:hypothetical protein [Alphaproteobacteria bacterium]
MDSATIAISLSPSPNKGKSGKDRASDDDADAFSISLEVAREQADGDTETTSITIEGVTTEHDGAGETEGEVTIEIETVVFSGDDLAENLSASTVVGGGAVALGEDGAFGVSGSISGDNEVRLEVGETLTFELPSTAGDVIGGQVTITNLFGDGETAEGALIFAYDANDQQLACYCAIGNETGTVTVDIDVPFARLDFKALDNESFILADNSDYGVSNISAVFASVVDDLPEGASELIDDILTGCGNHLAKLVDFGHFGSVHFEVSRVSANTRSTIDALSGARVEQDREHERRDEHDADLAARWRVEHRRIG